ncbi:baseplate assembly protein [Paracoccus sp. 22332]|uniref:baseplate assembly protein n=1 Tax=Paracoccus sp. 22332 TaxID=3453913 RepID=UPI003F840E06
MSRYVAIDLNQLPFPEIIGPLAYEDILAQLKADAIALAPSLAPALAVEGDPVQAVLQAIAYRALVHEARFNDIARSAYLSTATGADLDNLVAEYGVQRMVIEPADPDAVPPILAVMETDAELRNRAQIALESFSTAGPRGAYEYHALSADAQVLDAGVTSPAPGQVQVVVLGRSGVPASAVTDAVSNALNAEEVRPLCDTVIVLPAELVSYDVNAVLTFQSGPGSEATLLDAAAAVQEYTERQRKIGATIHRSALFAALHRPGVEAVSLTSPAADVTTTNLQAPWAGEIEITAA